MLSSFLLLNCYKVFIDVVLSAKFFGYVTIYKFDSSSLELSYLYSCLKPGILTWIPFDSNMYKH